MSNTFFNDMVQAVMDYPKTNVVIEITDVIIKGPALNTNETARFKVKVINNGLLNMTNVRLRITPLNEALVGFQDAALDDEDLFTTPIPKIRGHGGSQLTPDEPYVIKPPPTAGLQNIFQVTLDDWNGNFEHMLRGHSDPVDTVKDTWTVDVARE